MLVYKVPSKTYFKFSNCLSAVTTSIAYNYAKNYRYEALLYWGLRYLPPTMEKSFDSRIDRGGLFLSKDNLYPRITGLCRTEQEADSTEKIFNAVRRETGQNRPVAILLDTFYCPWNIGYQKIHLQHYVIALGIDENGILWCQDPFCGIEKVSMKNYDETQYKSLFYTYEYTGETDAEMDFHDLLMEAAIEYEEQQSAEMTYLFAEELKGIDSFYRCVADEPIKPLSPFFLHLRSVVYDRYNFFTLFVSEFSFAFSPEIIQLAKACCKMWNDVYLMLIKSLTSRFKPKAVTVAADLLIQTAQTERKIVSAVLARRRNGNGG